VGRIAHSPHPTSRPNQAFWIRPSVLRHSSQIYATGDKMKGKNSTDNTKIKTRSYKIKDKSSTDVTKIKTNNLMTSLERIKVLSCSKWRTKTRCMPGNSG